MLEEMGWKGTIIFWGTDGLPVTYMKRPPDSAVEAVPQIDAVLFEYNLSDLDNS